MRGKQKLYVGVAKAHPNRLIKGSRKSTKKSKKFRQTSSTKNLTLYTSCALSIGHIIATYIDAPRLLYPHPRSILPAHRHRVVYNTMDHVQRYTTRQEARDNCPQSRSTIISFLFRIFHLSCFVDSVKPAPAIQVSITTQ